jgi:gliding motility-associated-like protein
MKQKITYLLFLLTFSSLVGLGSLANAQSVTGVATTTGCSGGGTITASSTGLGATPQYQLLKDGVVLLPDASSTSTYTNSPIFNGLVSGSYTLKARANAISTVYASAVITVNNGYVAMNAVTPIKALSCVGGTTALTTTITGGKANYIYSISTQAVPGTALQTSTTTNATTFTFNPLPAGDYLVSITDDCGTTITSSSSINAPTGATVNDFKLGSVAYVNRTGMTCTNPFFVANELGFQYISNSGPISVADAARFTWKIKFQGQLYGQDTDADGYGDLGGPGFASNVNTARLPLVATRAALLTDHDNLRIVLSDDCGNSKEFPLRNYNAVSSVLETGNCGGDGLVRVFMGAGMACMPLNMTFTNTTNPLDVITASITNIAGQTVSGFTPGAKYSYTYIDNEGYTSELVKNLPVGGPITIPTLPTTSFVQNFFGEQKNLSYLDYGRLAVTYRPTLTTADPMTYTVTASSSPLVSVGYTNTVTLNGNGQLTLPNPTGGLPTFYWPKGNYTLSINMPCGPNSANFVVDGYTASLTGNTITPICGGFNYVMNGVFDVQNGYEVIIVSGPANVGAVRGLASTTSSLPFNGLTPGNYVFGLRIKGGTRIVLSQDVVYNATSVITVDKAATGGFVCTAGATNGVLTITASSASPAPGNILSYALSTDGGVTYGAYQLSNTFGGLTNQTYFFKVKDGCGNEVTNSAQIGVAAAPTASANGVSGTATICEAASGTIQLDVDILGASSYLWTGPGITAANQALKNPQVNANALAVGANNYSVTVTLGAPCNSSNVANLVVNITSKPSLVVTNPAAVCAPGTVNLTAAAVTAGSEAGLVLSYFSDAAATIALPNPNAIIASGTYYIKGSNGTTTCEDIKPVVVTINPLPIASISYASAPYCKRGTATVTQTGQPGGTYTSDAGLAINATTGAIDLLNSTTGSHTVTYTFTNSSCGSSTTTTITINATTLPTALADINAVCSATPTAPTINDPCAGVLTATTTAVFPITTPGTTVVTWSFDYGNGFTQTVNQNVNITLPAAPTVSVTEASCATPTATITVTSPIAGLTFSKDGVDYSNTTGVFSGLTAGSAYSITAKNSTGCVSLAATGTLAAGGVAPVLVINNPAAVCAPGTVDITSAAVTTGSTGGGTLSYWTNADGTGAITDPTQIAVSNTYYIKVTNGTCSDIKPVVVTINPAPTLTSAGSVSQAVCAGTAITNITYTVGGGATSITITGLPAGLTANIAAGVLTISGTPSATGTYSVETTGQAASCSPVVLGGTITVKPTPATPTVTAATATTFCTGGSVVLSSSSATGNQWYKDGVIITGETNQTYTANTTGNFTVVVTTTGCPSAPSTGTAVTVNPIPSSPLVSISANPVCGTPTGEITITAVAGETYSVDGSAYSATLTYAGLAPGNHTILAKSVDGCISAPTNITIAPAKTEAVKPVVTVSANPVCGTPTGEITITAVAGETYSVDGSAYSATLIYAGLAPGNHTILAKSVDGCISAATNITIAPAKVEAVKPVVAISAQPVCGTPTGSITITAVTGETYSVDGGTYSATLTYAGLAPGNHTILAKSVDGCISALTNITIAPAKVEAVKPVVTVSANPVCGTPTGEITITAVAGETYSVDGSAYSATLTYAGLAPGNHTILAKSVDGCISALTNITIAPAKVEAVKPVVTVSAQPVCGTPTGSITITAVAGETYSVDGGTYSATLTYAGLTPGNHTILAKSVDGCISAPTNITIAPAKVEATAPVVTVTSQPVCGTPTGSITITGVAGNTYSVDGGAYSSTLTYSGLTPGNHAIFAKSVDGCISPTSATITIEPAKVVANAPVVVVSAQPVCGTPTGSITITGVAGETYSVDGSAYTSTLTYAGLAPGKHTILAKSVDGCISATATTITINAAKVEAVKPVVTVSAQPVCGTPTGSITITGVAGNTYSVDGGAYTSTLTYAGLAPGNHTILSKSVDGCISTTATTITINAAKVEAVKPVVAVTAQPVCGTATGTITITPTANSTYSVDGGAYTSTLTYAGLTPGNHSILAKSIDGCISEVTTVTIDQAKATAAAPVVTISAQPTCAVATGSITITPTANTTYSVDGGAYSTITTYNLAAGNHTILAKSVDGCISTATNISINAQPATPVASISYGAAAYQAVGGTTITQTGQAGGTYSASPAGLSINASTGQLDLSTSTPNQHYTVTYTFSNGTCTSTATTTVRVNSRPAVIGYANPAYCATGTASVVQSGPTGGVYTASSTGLKINSSTGVINLGASIAGVYTVTYTYQDGSITASSTTVVTVNALPVLTLTSDIPVGSSLSLGDVVTLTATGGVTYSWTGDDIQSGQGTNQIKIRPRQGSTYRVTATNATGCSEVMEITIGIVADRKLVPNNIITPNGDGKNDTWVVKNLDYYPKNTVTIYDRAGRKLYSTQGYKNDWDGTYQGLPLAEGAYIYVIDSGAGIGLLRGTISILRDQR